MHKDQKRIKSAFLPRVMDRVFGTTSTDERDCTVLNRAFLQGPDPLFLMEACPAEFGKVCERLYLTLEEGRDAIERAHWQGPGILLDGSGLPFDFDDDERDDEVVPLGWRREALWLVLASVSDTTEEDYKAEVSLVERLQRAMGAGQNLALLVHAPGPQVDPWRVAMSSLKEFDDSCVFTGADGGGVPITDKDHGFYIGYKRGWKVVGVRHGNKTFFGTTPDTTLDEQGIKVDEKVSESYGFVRVGP